VLIKFANSKQRALDYPGYRKSINQHIRAG
jgi:hypothetical protein